MEINEEEQRKAEEAQIMLMVNKTTEAAIRLEEANKKAELLMSRQILSGKSEAGTVQPPAQTPEEKRKAESINYFKGSAIEKALVRHG
jgi:hypothetical protein